MITTGENCRIGNVKVLGNGKIILGDDVEIGDGVTINVTEELIIDDRSIIGNHFDIIGRKIHIGKEFWSGRYCGIGGGSCFEKASELYIGDLCHLGDFSFINTARKIEIRHEVGIGQFSRFYTHGAYQSFLRGFPIDFGPIVIEENVWCPNVVIMPNVIIGHDTVVGAGAIVTKSLPAGCLAVGIPAKPIKENIYPKQFSDNEFYKMIEDFIDHFQTNIMNSRKIQNMGSKVFVNGTLFDLRDLCIDGTVTPLTEKFKNELRRFGVRFRYYNKNGLYVRW